MFKPINFPLLCLFLWSLTSSYGQSCYRMVWNDEFNYTGQPDASKWGYDVHTPGWVNNELQNYTNNRRENARVENGNLIIEARRDWYQGYEYSSARLVTANRGDWLYGRVEVRAKLPGGRGTWPAIWMLPTDWTYGGWPSSGELDILEYVGYQPNTVHASVHTRDFNFMLGNNFTRTFTENTVEEAFHVYAMEWFADHIDFYIDNNKYATYTNANVGWGQYPFDKRFHLILNLAVGGNWGGAQGVDPAIFPTSLQVDYVRVYQKTTVCTQSPYGGTARAIPGTIEAEHFDEGGQDVSYKDNDNGNTGGAFRSTDVDLEACTDAGTGFNTGWTGANEWLEYTANVKATGNYNVEFRVASPNSGKQLRLEVDGAKIATVTVPQTGGWQNWQSVSALNIPLTQGSHIVRAYFVTDGFNLNWMKFTSAGNTKPTVNITFPTNNSVYTAPANITITANATDPDGTISKVEFYSGTKLLGDDKTAPYSIDWTSIGIGTYSITAVAYDNFPSSTTSSAITVTVKAPTTNGNGDGLTANYFNGMNFETPVLSRTDANLNLNWGTSAPATGVNADVFSARWTGQIQPMYSETYTFYITSDNGRRVWINNQLIVDKFTDDWGTTYTGTIALMANQKYDIRVDYFENAGGADIKLEWSSASQGREIVPQAQLYSNPLPTVSLTTATGPFTAPATVALSATASDNVSISKVEFFRGNTKIGEDNTAPYSFSWTNVAAGTHSITARAFDNLNAVIVSSASSVVVEPGVVNNPPTVAITSPANNASYVPPATVTINANASDDGSVTKVEFFNGSVLLGTDVTLPYSFTWSNVASGNYTVVVKATDNTGLTATASITITSVAVSTCTAPQYAENSGYVAGSKVKNGGKLYECKEYPFSGWCNGASWAYAPGTGSYWQDAWYDRGTCNARSDAEELELQYARSILVAPNPTQGTLNVYAPLEVTGNIYRVIDGMGKEVLAGTLQEQIDVSSLGNGMYSLIILHEGIVVRKQFVKN